MLSRSGLGSRTEAREWIGDGRVRVNGLLITDPDHWLDPSKDQVTVDGKPLGAKRIIDILLYKPTGYITAYKDPDGRPTVYDLLTGVDSFVATAGRLDLDTSGLLILTNDTDFANLITSPQSHVPKTYLVKTAAKLTDGQLDQLRNGIELKDGPTRPALVTRLRDSANKTFLEITLTEGRNRQVRRMIEALGTHVSKLVRVKIGEVEIGALPIGHWRPLKPQEKRHLQTGYTSQRS